MRIGHWITRWLMVALFAASLLLAVWAAPARSGAVSSSCRYKGIQLYGKVQVVDSFPDLKVEKVSSFPDLNVQQVSSFPNSCGQWQMVSSFPDFTVQWVSSFPDLKVQLVDSFPGVP